MHGKKKKKWGKICLFFADERYLRLSKICSLGIALPYVYYLYKKGFKYCIAANVRTIT